MLVTMDAYEELAVPNEYHPVEYFFSVKLSLFQDVILKFMGKGKSIATTQHEGMGMNIGEHSHAGTEE